MLTRFCDFFMNLQNAFGRNSDNLDVTANQLRIFVKVHGFIMLFMISHKIYMNNTLLSNN